MAKDRSFAAKVAKARRQAARTCPVCGGPISDVRVVKSVWSQKSGSWKFQQRMVAICKCNEEEFTG